MDYCIWNMVPSWDKRYGTKQASDAHAKKCDKMSQIYVLFQ